jgi:hypothetical protein
MPEAVGAASGLTLEGWFRMAMDYEDRHPLVQLLEDAGCEVFAYSGRAMYGTKCAALSGKLGDIMAQLIGACLHTDMPDDSKEVIEEAVRGMRTDSLGCDEVIYFPAAPFYEEQGS